jgi:hypothetical protein
MAWTAKIILTSPYIPIASHSLSGHSHPFTLFSLADEMGWEALQFEMLHIAGLPQWRS